MRRRAMPVPGIDSKIENKKLSQYFKTMPGSENMSDKYGPKLDSVSTCLRPTNAKIDRKRKTARSAAKNPRRLCMIQSCFSSPSRFMMREKRPRGTSEGFEACFSRLGIASGVAGEIYVNIRLSSRIDSNTSYLCILVH